MVLRVKPKPSRSQINSLYALMDSTLLHFISSVCHPWGSRCDPKTVGSVGLKQQHILVGMIAYPGRSH